MKTLARKTRRMLQILPLTLLAGVLWTGCSYSGAETRMGIGVEARSGETEFSVLAGYGEWAEYSPYGRVWRPYVIDGWQPFTDGYWAWTSSGWTWISYEPYGWLVYHYGDWDYDPDLGWFWIPGDVWSPARVRWITYGGYVGWAPIGPRGVLWGPPWEQMRFNAWTVVPLRDFDRDDVGRYRVAEPRFDQHRFDHRSDYHPPRLSSVRRAANHPIPRFNLQREPVRMGNRDFSRIVLPPKERQRVQEHMPEFRRQEGRPGHLRPVPERRRPEGQSPSHANRGQGHEGRNNHAGREPQNNDRGRARERERQRPGEYHRGGEQHAGNARAEQRHRAERPEQPGDRGRESARPHSRKRDDNKQPEHQRNRHYDPHREHQHERHSAKEQPKHRHDTLL